jgi:hypothetical protein
MPDKSSEVRVTALSLAVQTVSHVQGFTSFQVVQTAQLYEQYIVDGKVPPTATIPEPETQPAPQTFQEGHYGEL